jgi:transposase InsO family protein
MDFVHDELAGGKKFRALTIVDKLSREALEITVDFRLTSNQVIETLERLRVERGLPEIISVDNGSEFTSRALEQTICLWPDMVLRMPSQGPFLHSVLTWAPPLQSLLMAG